MEWSPGGEEVLCGVDHRGGRRGDLHGQRARLPLAQDISRRCRDDGESSLVKSSQVKSRKEIKLLGGGAGG